MIVSALFSYADIAKIFNISTTQICSIARNKIWKDVLIDTPIIDTPVKNFSRPGSKNGNAKLNEELVLKIREEYLLVKNILEMSRRYNISETQMHRIIKRECFKNV